MSRSKSDSDTRSSRSRSSSAASNFRWARERSASRKRNEMDGSTWTGYVYNQGLDLYDWAFKPQKEKSEFFSWIKGKFVRKRESRAEWLARTTCDTVCSTAATVFNWAKDTVVWMFSETPSTSQQPPSSTSHYPSSYYQATTPSPAQTNGHQTYPAPPPGHRWFRAPDGSVYSAPPSSARLTKPSSSG